MWENGPLSGKNEERGKNEISENEYSSTKLQVIQISEKYSDDRYRECCVVGYFSETPNKGFGRRRGKSVSEASPERFCKES